MASKHISIESSDGYTRAKKDRHKRGLRSFDQRDRGEPAEEITLDLFKPDQNYLDNEKRYEEMRKDILGEESKEELEGADVASDDLRRTIYLTIMSSVDFEEAGHRLLNIKLKPGQEMELCMILLGCCSQESTYRRYYGLLGQRFCKINKVYQENFKKCFVHQYSTSHQLEKNKLPNVAKFFAHLLVTDALPWHILAHIRLTKEDTTPSSRIFIKILLQELLEPLGICSLNKRFNDPKMQDSFESIFPKDKPKNTRFAIKFFTSIGLGGITENLREYLKNTPNLIMQQQKTVSESESESDDEFGIFGSMDSDTVSSESESESSSESESEKYEKRRKRRRI